MGELIIGLLGALVLSSFFWGPILIFSTLAKRKQNREKAAESGSKPDPDNLGSVIIVAGAAFVGLIGLVSGVVKGPYSTSSSTSFREGVSHLSASPSILGPKPDVEPIGNDIAVRASMNQDGTIKRKPHIRSYPDGDTSNNYSSNPGLYESRYGTQKPYNGSSNSHLANTPELSRSESLDGFIKKWKYHSLIDSLHHDGEELKVEVQPAFFAYNRYAQDKGMNDLLDEWRKAGGLSIEFLSPGGQVFAEGRYTVNKNSIYYELMNGRPY